MIPPDYHDQERWNEIERGIQQRSHSGDCKLCVDVSRSEMNNPENCLSARDRQRSEVGIIRQDDPPLKQSGLDNLGAPRRFISLMSERQRLSGRR